MSFGASCGNNCREEEGSYQFAHHLSILENSERGQHFCPFNPFPATRSQEDVRVRVAPPVAKFVVPCRGGFWHAIVGYLTKLQALLQISRGRRGCSIAWAIGLSSKRLLRLSKLHDRIVLLKTYRDVLRLFDREGVLITRPDRVCGGSAVNASPGRGVLPHRATRQALAMEAGGMGGAISTRPGRELRLWGVQKPLIRLLSTTTRTTKALIAGSLVASAVITAVCVGE